MQRLLGVVQHCADPGEAYEWGHAHGQGATVIAAGNCGHKRRLSPCAPVALAKAVAGGQLTEANDA
jgi:hypothetical protein